MFSLKNKKQNKAVFVLALFLFSSGVFLLTSMPVSAAGIGDWIGDLLGNTVGSAFKGLLYGIFVMFGWFASAAIALFGWAINPDYISGPSGLLNRASVYIMWKFIRDFFNLFFILTLLYTAFTIVFQVAKDYKKTLLSLVLAALFVNFSFPITRVIIDATNVPMYYFVNQLGTTKDGKSSLSTVLSASQLEKILLPNKIVTTDVSQILMAIVFIFIFSITLVVLAVMFIIRLAALVILLIFSSVGFAAAVIPGLQDYSNKWWKGLWQYALFGPAAMLMLVVATRFFAEIAEDNTVKQFVDTATKSNTPESASFVAAMAMFSIPIIMLWMALGLASSMSIAGAGAVVGQGQKFAKWAGRKTYNNTLTRGVGGGLKNRAENNKILKFVTPKYWADSGKKNEERIAARVGEGRAGYNRVVENQHNKKVAEEEKRMEESRTSDTALRAMVADPTKQDKASLEAAVRLLSKRGGFQNAAQLNEGLAAVDIANAGNPGAQEEKRAELIKKADKELFRDASTLVSAISHLGHDTKSIAQLVDKMDAKAFDGMTTAQYQSMVTANPAIKEKLDQKLKKEGHAKVLIDNDIAGVPGGAAPLSRQDAYNKHLGGMSAEDLGKVKGIHGGAGRAVDAETIAYITDQVHSGNWSPKEHADAYSKLTAEQKTAWRAAGINP